MNWVNSAAIIAAALMAFGGLYIVYDRLNKKNQGFGETTVKVIGTVLLLPTIIIIAALVESSSGFVAGLSALLGTVAGYVLSKSGKDE